VSAGVIIRQELADEMIEHCLAQRPNEACGILGTKAGEVVRVFRMSNADGSPVRYSLEPREQFAVYQTLDENDWELGAVFHSHTHTDAYPSPTDVHLASEDVPYLIVSLAHDPPSIRAFRIIKERWDDSEGVIEEVAVQIVG
jgi:[CysO sulfur-carrier protein]-S-L-cysteine hydrolase